ncbi:hypothetical protein PR048_012982 [Dryococelus australis]|uniref:Uncharacterized protein n=1 Tax=Dryococelus australis TaxID=614101 RepID=A0ABQ9HQW5_9NEOP|nr:hypothetical protein PR048_012982 [Dryococelus australis]
MLIIQNGCVIREYCLIFVLIYDLRGLDLACTIATIFQNVGIILDYLLSVTEIQDCIGTVTEVVSFFRCVVRRVKFDGLNIKIHCFCLINSETTIKSFNNHYYLNQTKKYDLSSYVKNAMRNEAITKFNQLKGHKTIFKSQFRANLEKKSRGRTMLQTNLNNSGGSKFPSISWTK